MTTVQHRVTHTVLQHWWQYTRREHRLCLRLVNETPEHLEQLPYLKILISKIDGIRLRSLRTTYPKSVQEVRSYLLSSENNFLNCLRALDKNNLAEANIYYNRAQNDLSLLRFILMEHGISTQL